MTASIVKNDSFIGPVRFGDHGFGELPPDTCLGPACWEWFDLLCLHRGALDVRIEPDGPLTLERGEGLLILPETRFQGRAQNSGARVSIQHFALPHQSSAWTPWTLERLRNRSRGVDRVQFLSVPALEADIERAISLAFAPDSPELYDLRVAQLVLILGHLRRQGDGLTAVPSDARAIELRHRLDKAPGIQDITPAIMAKWVGLSPSRFRVWFKTQFGESPKRYLMRRRINRATRLLRETSRPIKAIADTLGYADLPTFYHDFRCQTRTTPAAYRRNHTVLG